MHIKKNGLCCLLLALAGLTLCSCSKKNTASSGDITGFLIEDADQYVTLGEYKNLSLTQYQYVVTDDEVENTIMNRMIENMTYETVDRPAEYGDIVSLDLKAEENGGELLFEDTVMLDLGIEEYGYELDAALEGLSAGDELDLTVTFDEDNAPYEDWVGSAIHFIGTVKAIQEGYFPDLTDEYVKEHFDCDSVEAYEEQVRAELEKSSAQSSRDEAVTTLMDMAMENCTFQPYPSASEEASLSSDEMESELLELEAYLLEQETNSRLFISALCKKENLVLTESEYQNYLAIVLESGMSGYTDKETMEKELGQDLLIWNAYGYLAGNYLYDQADITIEEVEYSEWDLGVPEDPNADIGDVIEGLDE